MADRARFDVNNLPSLMAVSTADGSTPVDLWADPNSHGLVLSASSLTIGDVAVVDGGVTGANVLIAGTPQSTGNAQLTAGTSNLVVFTTTSVQAVATTDVGNYAYVSVQITGQGTTSTTTFQCSNDNVNWTNNSLMSSNSGSSATTNATTGTGMFHGPIAGRYFRINVTGITAGTTAGTIAFSTMPRTPVSIQTSTTLAALTPPADATATTDAGVDTMLFNGTTYDRQRGALAGIVLASAARTATVSTDVTNFNWRGVRIILNVTVASGTGGLQVQIRGKDSISAAYYTINATPTAVIATGITVYDVYPGIGAAANGITQTTSAAIPRTFNVNMLVGDASSYTYSVSYEGIL